jgi:hypothetical protein
LGPLVAIQEIVEHFGGGRAQNVPVLHHAADSWPVVDHVQTRITFISAYVFLALNGVELTLSEPKAVEMVLALASGELSQDEFADCLRKNTRSTRRKR